MLVQPFPIYNLLEAFYRGEAPIFAADWQLRFQLQLVPQVAGGRSANDLRAQRFWPMHQPCG